MTAKTTRKTGGRSRRTKGAGGIIHRADGRWEFRREIGRDPATGKRRFIAASGRTKADARERFGAKVAEMERTGLLPGAKSPYPALFSEGQGLRTVHEEDVPQSTSPIPIRKDKL